MANRATYAPLILIIFLTFAADASAQSGRGPHGNGPGRGQGFRRGQNNSEFQADREMFQFLLRHHDKISRSVKNLENGVETITESEDAKVAEYIQKHVAAMHRRVEQRRPIHRRDPLFDELFRHAGKIDMKLEKTEQGIRVVETSDDPYVASLIQAHARVVSLFVENGHTEVQKNHAIPERRWDGRKTAP